MTYSLSPAPQVIIILLKNAVEVRVTHYGLGTCRLRTVKYGYGYARSMFSFLLKVPHVYTVVNTG